MYSNTAFQQILKAIPPTLTSQVAKQTQVGRYDKIFSAREHLIALLYAQISGAKSLREIEAGLNFQAEHHYHLGIHPIRRSTLSEANQRRDPAFFKALVDTLIGMCHRTQRKALKPFIHLLDSTPIQVKGRGSEWTKACANPHIQGLKAHIMIDPEHAQPVYMEVTDANVSDLTAAKQIPLRANTYYVVDRGYVNYQWWHQIESAGAWFVTRFKTNSALLTVHQNPVQGEPILEDAVVKFRHNSNRAGHKNLYYNTPLRRVKVQREGKKPLVLATNDMHSQAADIAALYKQRWQVELFFKWIKQHLNIKRFIGQSKNAVMIQIYVAIIAYLLLWIYKQQQRNDAVSLHLLLVELTCSLFQRVETRQQHQARRRRTQLQAEFDERQGKLAL